MGQAMDFAAERTRMVEQLVRSRYVQDSRVRDAFLAVPREAFVRPEDADDAYADVPLPIGRGQTISAPSMIAIMLEAARLAERAGPDCRNPEGRRQPRDPGRNAVCLRAARRRAGLAGLAYAPAAGRPQASSGRDL